MSTITLVTGNAGKLAEWQRLFPASFTLTSADIDLDEIQSLDLEKIAIDKAKRAYEHIGSPVLVEDVSAGLVGMGGLPGPFIKYFEHALGRDALYQLAKDGDKTAIVTCTVGYFDGTHAIATKGEIHGSVVPMRGTNGFGFDIVFVPDGQNLTFAEMRADQKDAISHRSIAVREMVRKLSSIE